MEKEALDRIKKGIVEQKARIEVLKADIRDAEKAQIPMFDQRRRLTELESKVRAMESVYMPKT